MSDHTPLISEDGVIVTAAGLLLQNFLFNIKYADPYPIHLHMSKQPHVINITFSMCTFSFHFFYLRRMKNC